VEITLIDRRNFHLFQPLRYQVATGALSPGAVAYPLRAVFKRNRNVRVLLAEVDRFDLERREVVLGSVGGLPAPAPVPYDTLIVAGRLALLLLRPGRLERASRRGQVARERADRAKPHPARRGARQGAQRLPAVAVGEGRALAAPAGRHAGARQHRRRRRRDRRHAPGRGRRDAAHLGANRRLGRR
jgi:hypothetical protein